MQDSNKDKLLDPASPLPSSKSPAPPIETDLPTDVPADSDMSADADVEAKVATCYVFKLNILEMQEVETLV